MTEKGPLEERPQVDVLGAMQKKVANIDSGLMPLQCEGKSWLDGPGLIRRLVAGREVVD